MNGAFVAASFAVASIIASLFIGPEVGLFLALAGCLVAINAALDNGERKDARRRNQAHKR